MGILKDRFLIYIIILGFLIRIIFAFLPGFKVDVNAWFVWSERLTSLPLSQFYSDQIWTNYTPGYLYILYFLGHIKNLLGGGDGLFYLVLKLPAIIAEVVLTIFVYKKLIHQKRWAKISALAIIFNPAFIFNSSIWGQIDGLLTLMMVLTVFFLDKRNLVLSSIFWGLSFLIKPQTIALLPVYGIFIKRNIKNIIQIIFPAILIIFLFSLPFFPGQPLSGIFNLFFRMMRDYSFTSLYAYNFWGGLGFWIPDNLLWLGIPYQLWGYFLLIGFWVLVFLTTRHKLSLYSLAALATLSFFFLPTRVHERYLYPAIVFLIVVVSRMRSVKLLLMVVVLTFSHFLNLYYVYVYFNEFYYKMPKILYNPILYNFLDSFGGPISLLSMVIFILISIMIIKYAKIDK